MPRPESPFDVLVVDDDENIRDLLADFFRDNGHPVATAFDGRAAVAALERSEGRFGLVLTDISMPGIDGFGVLDAARLASPSSYVVMITGYASLDTAIQAVRAGAQDYLTKPFSLGQIDVVRRRALERFSIPYVVSSSAPRAHVSWPSPLPRDTRSTSELSTHLASIDARLASVERTLADLVALLSSDVGLRSRHTHPSES
jgi:DNA-binding response OmpR family regulator